MKFLIINGPNLNMLGIREPALYGKQDYEALIKFCEEACAEVGAKCECFQSNHEGALVDRIQEAYFQKIDGIVINPGAYTHTSVALLDALKAVSIPAIEVHLTNVNDRDEFRKVSFIREACLTAIIGEGFEGYRMAIERLKKHCEAVTIHGQKS